VALVEQACLAAAVDPAAKHAALPALLTRLQNEIEPFSASPQTPARAADRGLLHTCATAVPLGRSLSSSARRGQGSEYLHSVVPNTYPCQSRIPHNAALGFSAPRPHLPHQLPRQGGFEQLVREWAAPPGPNTGSAATLQPSPDPSKRAAERSLLRGGGGPLDGGGLLQNPARAERLPIPPPAGHRSAPPLSAALQPLRYGKACWLSRPLWDGMACEYAISHALPCTIPAAAASPLLRRTSYGRGYVVSHVRP